MKISKGKFEFSRKKLCQSEGSLLAFHLEQFYGAGTVSHIYTTLLNGPNRVHCIFEALDIVAFNKIFFSKYTIEQYVYFVLIVLFRIGAARQSWCDAILVTPFL